MCEMHLSSLPAYFLANLYRCPLQSGPRTKNVAPIHCCVSLATFTHVASWNIRVGMSRCSCVVLTSQRTGGGCTAGDSESRSRTTEYRLLLK